MIPIGPKRATMVQNGPGGQLSEMMPNGPMVLIGPYDPKWSQKVWNGSKWSEMVRNDPKWSEMVQMVPNDSKLSQIISSSQNIQMF